MASRLLIRYPTLLVVLILPGCVEEYVPEEDTLSPGILVVQADLTDHPGEQVIYLSRSSRLIYPKKEREEGCLVEVISREGEVRSFEEQEPGEYVGFLDEQFLHTGNAYSLRLLTREGQLYESGYEVFHPSVALDSLYYEPESVKGTGPGDVTEGIRFFADFTINRDSARYLRWKLTETYEFHNPSYRSYIYDVDRRMKDLPESLHWLVCWITTEVPDIYTLSMEHLSGNHYRRRALNFVSNEPQRLHHRYSLLVQQYSMSKEAFYYWNELRKNFQESSKLFESQPSLTPGNIENVNDPQDRVLGFFSISGISEKRIFVKDVPGLELVENKMYCFPGRPPPIGLGFISRKYLPLYFSEAWVSGERYFSEVNKHCVDCREYKGSSNIPPLWW